MNVVRVAGEGCAREDGRRETEGRRMSSSGTSSTRPLPHGAPPSHVLAFSTFPALSTPSITLNVDHYDSLGTED